MISFSISWNFEHREAKFVTMVLKKKKRRNYESNKALLHLGGNGILSLESYKLMSVFVVQNLC